MSDTKRMGVPILLDCERNLIFNLNVLEACLEKYGSMDAILNEPLANISSTKWLAEIMLREDAEIWNDEHPDQKKPILTEKQIARLLDGVGGIRDFSNAVREAMFKGLPKEQIEEVEEMEKNLIAAQMKPNRATRRGNRK